MDNLAAAAAAAPGLLSVQSASLHHIDYISGVSLHHVISVSGKSHMCSSARCLQLTPNDQNNKGVKVEVPPVRVLVVDVWQRTAEGFCQTLKKNLSLKYVKNAQNDINHKNFNSAM